MSSHDDAQSARLKRFIVIVATVLATITGFVNAVFLTSLIYPVSHVTGSLSRASVNGTLGDLIGLGTLVTIPLSFFIGAMTAGVLLGARPRGAGRRYGLALLAEAALLGAAPLMGTELHPIYAMILAAAACGFQNGAFSDYRGTVLRTSHMTGTLTDLGLLLGRRGYRNGQAWRGMLLATTLLTFVAGGVAGAHAATAAGIHALWIPALCCAVLGSCYATYRHRSAPPAGTGPNAAT